jgi:hypothetical protein
MMENNNDITENQRKYIFKLLNENSIPLEDLEKKIGKKVSELSKNEAYDIISEMVGKEPIKPVNTKEQQTVQQTQQTQQTVQPVQEKPKFAEQSDLAGQLGIPKELANMFFVKLAGGLYIKVAGLLYMAGKKGYQRIELHKLESQNGEYKYEALVFPKISIDALKAISGLDKDVQKMAFMELSKPTNGFGSASKENVKMVQMQAYMDEMAQTRALGRALRAYTGYGGTSYEELPESIIETD